MKIPGIKKVIIVASGKGGVGKSSVSVILAKQLQSKGFKVGMLDADIHGPSLPTIFSIEALNLEVINNKFKPIEKFGIKINSIGLLVKEDTALAWRGPMITKALNQLLYSTDWGDLDYLIIDMPPGTGDIHISLNQKCHIDGVVIVTIPDIISANDVSRSIDLYKKLNLNIIGIVENMSYLSLGKEKIQIYDTGATEKLISEFNIKLIAKLPIIPNLWKEEDIHLKETMRINFEY